LAAEQIVQGFQQCLAIADTKINLFPAGFPPAQSFIATNSVQEPSVLFVKSI